MARPQSCSAKAALWRCLLTGHGRLPRPRNHRPSSNSYPPAPFGTWFSYAQLHVTKPWFCAVSFVNPHDMSGFPYSYGLAGIADPNGPGNFGYAAAGLVGYCPPFTDGYTPVKPQGVDETIMAMPSPLPYPPNGAPPTGPNNPLWNNPDDPSQQPYGPT